MTPDSSPSPSVQLVVDNLDLRFGGVSALSGLSLQTRRGEVTAFIGPNGAGKTSLLNCIGGLYRGQTGSITYRDAGGKRHHLHRLRPDQIARLGIARTFQNIELFRHMTVLQNTALGRHLHLCGNVFTCAVYWGRQRREEIAHRQRVEAIIDFLDLQPVRHRRVGALSYGGRKRVELARALALEPDLILLDEPLAGMNAEEKEQMARSILDMHEEWGVTPIVIDHDMDVVMDISDRVVVLDFGRVIASGTPQEIRRHPAVIAAYLGEDDQ